MHCIPSLLRNLDHLLRNCLTALMGEVAGAQEMDCATVEGFIDTTSRGLQECFHSGDRRACFSAKTKENLCITIEFNSRAISWGQQHGFRDVT